MLMLLTGTDETALSQGGLQRSHGHSQIASQSRCKCKCTHKNGVSGLRCASANGHVEVVKLLNGTCKSDIRKVFSFMSYQQVI